jgi:MscS family membrane protein
MDWQVLNEMFLGNSLRNWIVCGGVLLFTLLFNHLLAKLLSKGSFRFFKRFSDRRFHTVFTEILHKPFVQLINLLALYLAFQHLRFPESWNMAVVSEFGVKWIINVLYTILLIFAFSNLFLKGVEFWEYAIHHQEEATISPDLATFIKRFAQVIIFVGAFFTILAKAFEVNITAVVTSLGIGGLAIALAAQDTLANLIASFIIFNTSFKEYKPSVASVDFSLSKGLFAKGLQFFVIQLASIFMFTSNNLVVAQLFGPMEVTTFSLVNKLFSIPL